MLPTLAQCTVTPTLAGCSVVLPADLSGFAQLQSAPPAAAAINSANEPSAAWACKSMPGSYPNSRDPITDADSDEPHPADEARPVGFEPARIDSEYRCEP